MGDESKPLLIVVVTVFIFSCFDCTIIVPDIFGYVSEATLPIFQTATLVVSSYKTDPTLQFKLTVFACLAKGMMTSTSSTFPEEF